MKRILTVIGARPQFIKAAAVCRALQELKGVREILLHTGQHFDHGMSDIFFEELGIPKPDYHLGVGGGSHGAMTGAMLQKLEPLIKDLKPDCVLVYGDTNSTLAGALAASKLNVPVAHVEAGLRSFNRRMPEEQNRIVTDHLSDYLFTPTNTATKNLRREGLGDERIHQVGDVMYDTVLFYAERAKVHSKILARNELVERHYVLATLHRAENTDDGLRLRAIISELDEVAKSLPVVLPLHPRTRLAFDREQIRPERIKLIDPVGYLDMVALEANAAVIATDSGGVQKEAYFQGVPCVTLRTETEWTELIDLGWNRLAPPGESAIASMILEARTSGGKDAYLYGTGAAAVAIANRLVE